MSDAGEQTQPSGNTETPATPQQGSTAGTEVVDPWAAMPRRKGRLMTSRNAAAMAMMSGFLGAMGPIASAATAAPTDAAPAADSTETTNTSSGGRPGPQGVSFDMHSALHDACKAGSLDAFNYVMKLPGIDVCATLPISFVYTHTDANMLLTTTTKNNNR